jgi:anti-anti-sigma factor
MAIQLTVSQLAGRVPITVLRPSGDLDASNYQDLIAEAEKIYESGARDVLLDLSEVPYMSSSGLVALQSIAALLRGEAPPNPEEGWSAFRAIHRDRSAGRQAHFKLLNPQPKVDSVLDAVGFKQFLEVAFDLEAAVASF